MRNNECFRSGARLDGGRRALLIGGRAERRRRSRVAGRHVLSARPAGRRHSACAIRSALALYESSQVLVYASRGFKVDESVCITSAFDRQQQVRDGAWIGDEQASPPAQSLPRLTWVRSVGLHLIRVVLGMPSRPSLALGKTGRGHHKLTAPAA